MGVLGGGMEIRDRIRELRRVPAKQLRANPKNWRMHPVGQREAMQGVLTEIGYADALIARECADGSLMLIDGHLRAETTPDQMVPVLVLDVTESEADKLLLTLDPLAGMAETNEELLAQLAAQTDIDSEAVRAMVAALPVSGNNLVEGWGKTADNMADKPKNVVASVMLFVGELCAFESRLGSVALPGERPADTIMRALDAIDKKK